MMVLSKVKVFHYIGNVPVATGSNSVVAGSNSVATRSLQEFCCCRITIGLLLQDHYRIVVVGSLHESLNRFSDQTARTIEKLKHGFCSEHHR